MGNIYTIVDIETSGFNRSADNIFEVGFIRCTDDLDIINSGSFYFWQDGWKIGAADVHGLTRPFLEKYESEFDTSLATLYALIHKAVLVGKNIEGFDIPFIQSFINRYCRSLGEPIPRGFIDVQPHYELDFRMWYHKKFGESTMKKGTLEQQCMVAGITDAHIKEMYKALNNNPEREQFHSALYDVAATYLLVLHLAKVKGKNIKL